MVPLSQRPYLYGSGHAIVSVRSFATDCNKYTILVLQGQAFETQRVLTRALHYCRLIAAQPSAIAAIGTSPQNSTSAGSAHSPSRCSDVVIVGASNS